MELLVAKTAGFCMGVDMALKKLDQALANPGRQGRLFTIGPIIHNPQVLQAYRLQGVLQTADPADVSPGDTVVVRAHGIPLDVQARYEERGVELIDATCPKVKKAQVLIARESQNGGHLLLFGERDHPEVRGLLSYAQRCTLFESLEDLQELSFDPRERYFVAAQTTQDRGIFDEVCSMIRGYIGDVVLLDTICMATKDRQNEVRGIAGKVRAMVIVGGRESGNTRRLAQIAAESGVFTVHVETAAELPLDELRRHAVVGLSAGASTPSWIIEEVAQTLQRAEK